jgi:hypothetical protein
LGELIDSGERGGGAILFERGSQGIRRPLSYAVSASRLAVFNIISGFLSRGVGLNELLGLKVVTALCEMGSQLRSHFWRNAPGAMTSTACNCTLNPARRGRAQKAAQKVLSPRMAADIAITLRGI